MTATSITPRIVALMVFPFFFFYHALAAFDVIPLFLGSWWSMSLGLALVVLLPFALPKVVNTWPLHVPVIILAAIATTYAIYYWRFGAEYQNSTAYFLYSAKLIVGWGGLYCLGLLLKPSKRFASVTFWTVMAMIVITPFLIQTGIYTNEAKVAAKIVGLSNYQYFAMTFVFTAMIAVGCNWSNGRDAIVVGAGISATYFLLARSELAGFVAVFAGWLVLAAISRRWRAIILSIVALAAAFIYVGAVIKLTPLINATASSLLEREIGCCDGGKVNQSVLRGKTAPYDVAAQASTRQAEAFDLDASASWNYRAEYMAKGVEAIKRSPILGDYGGQVRDFKNPGAYIHNMLDVWRQYGIIAFIIYAGLCVGGVAFALWQVLRLKKMDPLWVLTAIISGYVFVLSAGAKSVFWPLVAFGWGMIAARLTEHKSKATETAPSSTTAVQNPSWNQAA